MTREQADRQAMIDRYVAGRLPEADAEALEERMLWDHELADDIELTARLRDGLAAVADQPFVADKPESTAAPRWLALAASFAGGVLLTSLLLRTATEAPQIAQPASVQLLETFRGQPARQVHIAPDAVTVLRVDIFDPDLRYDVMVVDAENVLQHTLHGLTPDAEERLSIALPAGALPDGRYTLRVLAAGSAEPQREIAFVVNPRQP